MKRFLPYIVMGAIGVVIYYLFAGKKDLYSSSSPQTVSASKPRVSYPPVVSGDQNGAIVFPISPSFWPQ